MSPCVPVRLLSAGAVILPPELADHLGDLARFEAAACQNSDTRRTHFLPVYD
jgi:hypothetical protein